MTLTKRAGIFILLCSCLFVVWKDHAAHAQTSCPARDQCRDAALAAYSDEIAQANQAYADCVNFATMLRNSCLSSVEEARSQCRGVADQQYEIGLSRCQAIPENRERDHCMQEIESIRQQSYSVCDFEYDSWASGCWNDYYPRDQACTNEVV